MCSLTLVKELSKPSSVIRPLSRSSSHSAVAGTNSTAMSAKEATLRKLAERS